MISKSAKPDDRGPADGEEGPMPQQTHEEDLSRLLGQG